MIVCLLQVGGWIYAGTAYYLGVGLVAAILAFEHFLVSDARIDGTSKNINAAFFNANASVSIVYFVFLAVDQWGVW
jgi:4-hydroxybenzoate polyprenyltransferase